MRYDQQSKAAEHQPIDPPPPFCMLEPLHEDCIVKQSPILNTSRARRASELLCKNGKSGARDVVQCSLLVIDKASAQVLRKAICR